MQRITSLHVRSQASKLSHISPRNENQERYMQMLQKPRPYIVVASGSAGTGKTLLATYVGVERLLKNEVKKLVITRPAVSVDESHGFLPGSLEKKMEPWIRPVLDALSREFPKSKIDGLMKDGVIEICPLAFMRGRTFENSWVICDEAQNSTVHQMLMLLTRIGDKSKMVITGDPLQYDRGYEVNGLNDLLQRLEYDYEADNIGVVEFSENDVERHPIIPYVLNLYKHL